MEKKKIVLYSGTFDPFHKGHQNVADKAAAIFGKENILICCGWNSDKGDPNEELLRSRANNIQETTGFNAIYFTGLFPDLVKSYEGLLYDVISLKGLRNGNDLAYEQNQLRFIEDLYPGIKTIFVISDPEYGHISSSSLRALERAKEGLSKKYLP